MSRTIHHIRQRHFRAESRHWIFALRYSRGNSAPSRVTRVVVIRKLHRRSVADEAIQFQRRRRAADRVTARMALQVLRADPTAEIEFGDPRHRRHALWLA
ncbi:hypothetical protein [Herbidospora sp. RD11066]